MSLPSLEAGYAAAAAEVARLTAELIVAKQSVSWYAAALRRQQRQKLEAQYQESLLVDVQQKQQVEEAADKSRKDIPSCRRAQGLSKAEFLEREAKKPRLA